LDILKPTPLQQIIDPEIDAYGVALYIKRDDLLHPQVSGNKWRKLKCNLDHAKQEGFRTLLSFGGAYSNHIYALAAAGKLMDYKTIGIIRGEETMPLNSTLVFARSCGMQLFYESRENYKNKDTAEYIMQLKKKFGDFYLLPEGGTNTYAIQGCAEIVEEIQLPYDTFCCACGSGGTLAGLAQGQRSKGGTVLGICVLKGEGMLDEKISGLLHPKDTGNWSINYQYHFGGYAKMNRELVCFIQKFKTIHGILLEPVYTGKMMFAIYDLIKKGYFKRGESIIALHTGGLQALEGLKDKMLKLADT
jgi:1-aminocyclopropane-1-carboxylate deaminase